MFMRLLQIKVNPTYNDEIAKFYRETVSPKLQTIPGCIFAVLIKSKPDENEFISLTFWQTQKHAENYENSSTFKELSDRVKPYLSDSSEWKIQLSEDMKINYLDEPEIPAAKKYTIDVQKEETDKIEIDNNKMFVRIVSIKVQESKMEELKMIYAQSIIPAFRKTKGCRYAFLTHSINENEDFLSVTIWDTKEDASNFEISDTYKTLLDKVKHTFSQFYLWKMSLEKQYNSHVKTSDDLTVGNYDIVTGRNFV